MISWITKYRLGSGVHHLRAPGCVGRVVMVRRNRQDDQARSRRPLLFVSCLLFALLLERVRDFLETALETSTRLSTSPSLRAVGLAVASFTTTTYLFVPPDTHAPRPVSAAQPKFNVMITLFIFLTASSTGQIMRLRPLRHRRACVAALQCCCW